MVLKVGLEVVVLELVLKVGLKVVVAVVLKGAPGAPTQEELEEEVGRA